MAAKDEILNKSPLVFPAAVTLNAQKLSFQTKDTVISAQHELSIAPRPLFHFSIYSLNFRNPGWAKIQHGFLSRYAFQVIQRVMTTPVAHFLESSSVIAHQHGNEVFPRPVQGHPFI